VFKALRRQLSKKFLKTNDWNGLPTQTASIAYSILPEVYTWAKQNNLSEHIILVITEVSRTVGKLPELRFEFGVPTSAEPMFRKFLEDNIFKLLWKHGKVNYFLPVKDPVNHMVQKKNVSNFHLSVLEHLDKMVDLLDPADWYISPVTSFFQTHTSKQNGIISLYFFNDESLNFYKLTMPKE